jgi:hypothetical protein
MEGLMIIQGCDCDDRGRNTSILARARISVLSTGSLI